MSKKDGCSVDHRHRYVVIDMDKRSGRALLSVLRTVVATTCDRDKARGSRFAWGRFAWGVMEYSPPGRDFVAYEYVLTVLGVLHGLFGTTVVIAEGTAASDGTVTLRSA